MRDANNYVPISAYAFLSDCRSAALVASDGAVDWLCWPRFDSPSLFGALVDSNHGGSFVVRPDMEYRSSRRYLPGTLVLETTFTTATGIVRVTDWLHKGSRQALCRLITCLEGEVPMLLHCDLRPDYGREVAHWQERMSYLVCDTQAHGRIVLDGLDDPQERTVMHAGDVRELSLCSQRPGPSDALLSLERTVDFWEDWTEDLKLPALRPMAVQQSALVLKGLQYEPSGAIIAAATTSLPEEIGGERNYDYRFSWLRDAAFTLYALARCGKRDEAHSYFDWLKALALHSGSANLQVMYGVEGETDLTEFTLDHLEGYQTSAPVRIGNAAATQRQLDVYGEVMDAIWLQRTLLKRPLSRHRWPFVHALAQRAMEEWREPDEGIWEVRGGPQHFVYSKVMCWVALDRALKLAGHEPDQVDDITKAAWAHERTLIQTDIHEHGYNHDLGMFTQAYGSQSADAANLLLAQVGFISPSDPKFISTVRVTGERLTRGGFVDRYEDNTADGFAGREGTFTIASFWMVLALLQIGETEEAIVLFNRVCDRANDVGLLSEELAPSGEQLGNFPQAFTHIALIACAYALSRAGVRDSAPNEPLFAD